MSGNNRVLGSDLAKIDAHIITHEEYEEIPELTDDFFERADECMGGKLVRRGRSSGHGTKVSTAVRFDSGLLRPFVPPARGGKHG